MSQVGARIRELRKRRKWTLEDLASRTGVTFSMLGHIERGARSGTPEVIQDIAKAFGIAYGILIDPMFDLDRAAEISRIAEGITHLDDRQVSVILDMIDTLKPSD